MRQFREPFSLETAEGFPVDGIRMASRAHVRRASDAPEKSERKKNEGNNSKSTKQEE